MTRSSGPAGWARYRATDTRLQRTVAIKVLPPAHAADPQFRARFDREAQVIAALTDPHVCRVYDVGQHADTAYIVMEYLEGETLAARLSRGTLPFVQALAWAIDIADALAAAHRLGVVHRDLKPGNVMLTRSGAMLLDFGLAKATTAHLGAPASLAATAPDHLTAQGTILGTFQYMSPEQLEGRDADARSDIFAFGALAYEMFTGNKAFEAKSQASLIAAILEREPPPIAAVQPLSPPSVDRVVKACLAKESDQRWQNAADLARELRWCGEPIATAVRPRARRRLMLASLAATVLVALAGVLVAAAILSKTRSATSADVVRFAIQPPEDRSFSGSPAGGSVPLAISPDGRRAVFGVEKDGVASLWVRSLDSLESHELPGTTNPRYPFWSPDNRLVGFFTQTDLKKVDLEGGAAQKIVDADNGTGGSWGRDGNIQYALLNRGLFLVAASGGTPKPLPSTDVARPRFPWLLPDGIHFIVSQANTDRGDVGTVYFGSIDGGQLTPVVEAARGAKYAVGHLLFVRGQTLFAQPFDPEKGVVSGIAAPLLEGVASTTTGAAAYSMSDRVLLHATGDRTVYQLQWVDRTGRLLEKIGSPNTYSSILLSKDERRIFTTRRDPTGIQNVWQFTTDRGVDTLAGAGDNNPVLSPEVTDECGTPVGEAMCRRGDRANTSIYSLRPRESPCIRRSSLNVVAGDA